MDQQIPEALRAARRSLETITAVRLLNDWSWVNDLAMWVLHCKISILSSDKDLVPDQTEWFVLVSSDYPYGYLEFFPSKKNSLTKTFPHQMFNGEGKSHLPWREGNICLSSSSGISKRQFSNIESFEIDWRLHWRFERAVEWLSAASKGQLHSPGDPFELPDFPKKNQKTLASVAFDEDDGSFSQWEQISDLIGLVDLYPIREGSKTLFPKIFRTTTGKELVRPDWGIDLIEINRNKVAGLWIRLTQIPVIQPWQIPSNWKELREVFREQDYNLDELLKSSLKLVRNEAIQLLLIGFPIPSKVGASFCQIHWQGIKMPVLSNGKETAKGFRQNELGYWQRDRVELLRGMNELRWMNSENWNSKQTMTRGRFCQELTSKKVLLIGAGALGSVIGEMLVRGGVQDILIVDSDELEIGNICRHTLTAKALNKSKSVELSHQLNCIFPHTKAKALDCKFPPLLEAQLDCIQQSDLVLDCTGSDIIIQQLEQFAWKSDKFFVSMSLGMEARRLFLFVSKGNFFPSKSFRKSLAPWLVKEKAEFENKPLPWSGIGCWHPVFPARVDDIWMLSAVGVKCINKLMKTSFLIDKMMVFEQDLDTNSDCFQGIRRVEINE